MDVLLGDEHRQPRTPEPGELRGQHLDDQRRQTFRRFVEEEERRVSHERARDREHLLLAAGQAAGWPVSQRLEMWEQVENPIGRPPLAGAVAPRAPRYLEVLANGQIAEDAALLRHVADPEASDSKGREPDQRLPSQRDLLGTRRDEPDDALERRGLAGAVPAQQAHDLTLGDLEREIVEDVAVAVVRVDPDDLEEPHQYALFDRWPRYSRCTSGSPRTSRGVPSAITPPWCRTEMCRATAKTTSMSCSVNTIVSRASAAIPAASAMIS